MPTPNAVALVRSALQRAMANLGGRNGHALPEGAGNHDGLLHELFVASEGSAYFKKRFDSAKNSIRDWVTEVEGSDQISEVEPGTEQVILSGVHYDLIVKCNNPSMRPDLGRLLEMVNRTFNVQITENEWKGLVEASKVPSTAARTIRAVPRT